MIKASKDTILQTAQTLSQQKKSWHFHILTPQCQLNETNKFALILENCTDSKSYVTYSEKLYMTAGKVLIQVLHGDDVIQETKTEHIPPSTEVKKLLKRAKELKELGTFRHHHMLFPDFIFNKNKGKWTIIFEDQEKNEIIEKISDDEPKNDLQHIEALFYRQK